MRPASTSADVIVFPPHASQYPASWSGSISVVWSQPSVMQMAGHTLISGTCFQQIVQTLVALLAKLHQLRGSRGKDNAGHILLLATGVRIIRAPDREAELLGHSLLQLQNAPRPRLSPQTTLRE
jgi:hypothetical protein